MHRLYVGPVCSRAQRQSNAASVQERCDTVVARLAIDVTAVIRIDVERDESFAFPVSTLLEEFIEQFLPCSGVHACGFGQDAVQIEQKRVVVTRRERDNGSCTSHGYSLM